MSRFWWEVTASQQTQNICITFVQRRPNVFDVGQTLYKCYTNVLCLLGLDRRLIKVLASYSHTTRKYSKLFGQTNLYVDMCLFSMCHLVGLLNVNLLLQVTQSCDKHGVSMVSYNILQVTQSEDKHSVSMVSYNIIQVTQSEARC